MGGGARRNSSNNEIKLWQRAKVEVQPTDHATGTCIETGWLHKRPIANQPDRGVCGTDAVSKSKSRMQEVPAAVALIATRATADCLATSRPPIRAAESDRNHQSVHSPAELRDLRLGRAVKRQLNAFTLSAGDTHTPHRRLDPPALRIQSRKSL